MADPQLSEPQVEPDDSNRADLAFFSNGEREVESRNQQQTDPKEDTDNSNNQSATTVLSEDDRHQLIKLTKAGKFEEAKQVISHLQDKFMPIIPERESLRTATHYAAMSEEGAALLQDLKALDGASCLSRADRKGTTSLHLAAQFLSKETWLRTIKPLVTASDLRKKDDKWDTCAHIAARDNSVDDGVILEIVDALGDRCLEVLNRKGETPLQLAMKHCGPESAEALLQKFDLKVLQDTTDDEGNTLAHFAAKNPKDILLVFDNRLRELRGDPNPDSDSDSCLYWTNNNGETVLQIALECCSVPTAQKLLQRAAKSEAIQQRDSAGNTCLHIAAMSSGRQELLLTAVKLHKPLGPECLAWKNQAGDSVLHVALENCPQDDKALTKLLAKLISKSTKDILSQTDAAGNSCLHIAARRSDKLALLSKAKKVCGKSYVYWQNSRLQSVLFFAIGVVSAKQLKAAVHQSSLKDVFGNTALHYLLQGYGSETNGLSLLDSVSDILDKIKVLIGMGIEPKEENKMGQNFLHWAQLETDVLRELLKAFATNKTFDFRYLFKQVEFGSNGLHLVHTYSRKYNLEELIPPIAELSGMKENELLSLTVSKGANKDATCLHFACEGGKKRNVQYLLEKEQKLKKFTESGMSCIDFAIDRGWLKEIWAIYVEYETTRTETSDFKSEVNTARIKLLRLIDPARRALRLPDRVTAQRNLASILDHYFAQKSEEPTFSSKDRGLHILERAIELNSTKIYRSALRMNFVHAVTETRLPAFLFQRNNSPSAIGISRQGESSGPYKLIQASSEMSVIDIVSLYYSHYDEILPDLILTRQFELIPASIGLLILLGPEIEKLRSEARGKHARLQELHTRVLNIAVNALDELFASASKTEKTLLFDYLQGQIVGDDGALGPKFPFRNFDKEIRYGSVLKMIEEADCNELFATDCIYSFVQEEWKRGRRPCQCCTDSNGSTNATEKVKVSENQQTPSSDESKYQQHGAAVPSDKASAESSCWGKFNSPKAKFIGHYTSFSFLMVYFIWYTVDFKQSFSTALSDIPIVLYFLSFLLQEIADIYRRRKRRQYFVCDAFFLRLPRYFKDVLNFLDWFAMIFVFVGLILKWILLTESRKLHDAYPCQVVFSVAFGLLMFRSVHFLSLSAVIGPVVAMLWSLLFNDLVPFLAIIGVIIGAFGVFFFNLLFSITGVDTRSAYYNSSWYGWDTFVQAITLPFNILFTNFDKVIFDKSLTNITIGKVAHSQGIGVFENLMMFLFMGLVNIVMLNLLIALFNLRVSRMANEALGIWRKTYFGMLREYQGLSPWPPPLSFIWFIYDFVRGSCKCRKGRKFVRVTQEKAHWWQDESKYPENYMKFLEFQANQLRRIRPRLLLSNFGSNNQQDELAELTEATGAQLADVRTELQEARQGTPADDLTSQRLKAVEDQTREIHAMLQSLVRKK